LKTCPACHATCPGDFTVCPRDAAPLIEALVWSPGAVIRGKYRVLSEIGRGGMGAVYKAAHLRFNELRALKAMSPELMNDVVFRKRFEHEAVFARRLQHPNVVRIDDIDEAEDGTPFIVMEYIDGQSLKKVVQAEGAVFVPRLLDRKASGVGAGGQPMRSASSTVTSSPRIFSWSATQGAKRRRCSISES
jgi:serine/threonine-protein kinase